MKQAVKKQKKKGHEFKNRALFSILSGFLMLTICLSNVTPVKAWKAHNGELDYERYITVNMNGGTGSNPGGEYYSVVDRDGCGYKKGKELSGLAVGYTVADCYNTAHKVQGFSGVTDPNTALKNATGSVRLYERADGLSRCAISNTRIS